MKATTSSVVIVRDMWLTGFDVPSLHTMYVDKPMQGHNLMQAIARVNRVYPGKDGGLVVAYLPLQAAASGGPAGLHRGRPRRKPAGCRMRLPPS